MAYISPLPPREHQVRAMAKARGRAAFAYLMDMGCVDRDTEYLSPTGWQKIGEYKRGKVAQFNLDGTATFVKPNAYVVKPCSEFFHYTTDRGMDQMLSSGHRILFCGAPSATRIPNAVKLGDVPPGSRTLERSWNSTWFEATPEDKLNKLVRVPTTCHLQTETAFPLTDNEMRVQIAFHADGSFGTRDLSKLTRRRKGCIRIKKQYKKDRIRELLQAANIEFDERVAQPEGFSLFIFLPPMISKTFDKEWYRCSYAQRQLVSEEIHRWDGRETKSEGHHYSSMHEGDADFVQWCFSTTGQRCSKQLGADRTWYIHATGTGRVNNLAMMRGYEMAPSPDGKMYCFNVPSGYLVLRRNGRVFMTGNTGKSKVILDEWGEMEDAGEVSDLLIVAPAGCYANWTVDRGPDQPSEITKQLPPELRERAVVGTFAAGGGVGAKRALERLLAVRDRPRILTVNVEALSSVKAARDLCTAFLSRRRAMVAIDESPAIKNPDAERTKTVVNLGGLAPYRRIASGLVAPNSPMDLFSQFEFLDWKILGQRSFYGFQARYAVTKKMQLGGTILKDARGQFLRDENGQPLRQDAPGNKVRTANVIVGYKNEEDLRERIEHHSFRVTKEECLDLPPKIYMPPRAVEMTDEQRRVYKELKNVATAELNAGGFVSVQSALTMMLRLQQILCGHVADEEGNIKPVASNRIRALMEIVDQHRRKGIIWANFDYSIREICDVLRKEYGPNSVAAFWGGNRSTRGEDEARFLADPDCRWMVATPAAGGRGNTWVNSDLTIYYANGYSLDHRLQSEDRNHRDGQKMPVSYEDLCCYGTTDEKILHALRKKLDLASMINGDNWRQWVV